MEGASLMLIGFKKQFASKVLDGTKTQTIRKVSSSPKAHVPKVGETLYLYTGLRTKYCQHLKDAVCTDTFPLSLAYYPDHYGKPAWRIEVPMVKGKEFFAEVAGRAVLSDSRCDYLAVKDGFKDAAEMMAWFYKEHKDLLNPSDLKFNFRVIRW